MNELQAFEKHLRENEKSPAAIEKYLRDARAFLLEVWGDAERTVGAGEKLSTEQVSLLQLGTIATNRTAQYIAKTIQQLQILRAVYAV